LSVWHKNPLFGDARCASVGRTVRLGDDAAGLDLAIERGWLELHDSGTFVKLTQGGADLFA
jgi:hypothetical protein